MILVLGYPGSGTKMVARGIACALYGTEDHTEEPFPTMVLRRYFESGDRTEIDQATESHLRTLPARNWPVVKDEFWVPAQLRAIESSIYVVRSTLGNVQFLLTWGGLEGWWWYFKGLKDLHHEEALAMWPDGVEWSDKVCTLAVAHEIQVHHDLVAAQEAGRRVYSYEELTANYSIAWPALVYDLGIEPKPEFHEFVQAAKNPPYFPLVRDWSVIERVREVVRRAQQHYQSPSGKGAAVLPAGLRE